MNIKIVRERQTEIESVLFYIFWGILAGGNAAGYTLGNECFRYICYASMLLLFVKFLISDYERKERFICALLLALGLLIWHFSRRVTPFFTMLAITSMKNVDYQNVVKFTFWLTGILFVVRTSLAMAGVLDIGKEVLSTGRVRYWLSYDHPNVVQEILFLVVASCILAYHHRLRIYHYLALEIYNYFVFWYTDSRTGFTVTTICIVLSCIVEFRKARAILYEIMKRFADKAFFIVTVLNIWITFIYSTFAHSEIDFSKPYATFLLRFRNASDIVTSHALNLFGIPEVELMDGMVNVIYGNGMIFVLLFLHGYYLLLRRHRKKEDIYFMIVCCCYALYGIVESYPVSIFMNITLPALSELIFKEKMLRRKRKTAEKIRILHVSQAAGGVDRYLQMLIKHLDPNKIENVLVGSYDFKKDSYRNSVLAFRQLNMNKKFGLINLRAVYHVRLLIKEYDPDIVYAHSSIAGMIVRIADIGLKNICIYNPHGWSFDMGIPEQKLLFVFLEKLAAFFCKKIICVSDMEKKSALENKICPEQKLQVIWSGIDIKNYETSFESEYSRQTFNIPDCSFVVGMVGRISPQKAPDIFIKAAVRIRQEIPFSYFIIVGDGEQREAIEKIAEENKLTNCLLITGWVDNPMSYIELFDVALHLPRWEGFGLVLPEFMLARKPIVATRAGAIPSIITDYENGLLTDIDDVDGICEAVKEIHENKELCERIVERGYKEVYRRFDITRVANEHERLFDMLLLQKEHIS